MYRVCLPHATFGLEVRDGVVVRAAPIARWTEGKPIADVLGYYLRRYRGEVCQAIVGIEDEEAVAR